MKGPRSEAFGKACCLGAVRRSGEQRTDSRTWASTLAAVHSVLTGCVIVSIYLMFANHFYVTVRDY